MEDSVAPSIRVVIINSRPLVLVMVFIIAKYSKMANRKKMNPVKASARFKEKNAEPKETSVNSMMGRSKGVDRNLILPSIIVFMLNIRILRETVTHKRICLGSVKGSVVKVRKKSGRKNKNAPSINTLAFSR